MEINKEELKSMKKTLSDGLDVIRESVANISNEDLAKEIHALAAFAEKIVPSLPEFAVNKAYLQIGSTMFVLNYLLIERFEKILKNNEITRN